MSTYYYADATNQAVGPYPLSELQALARSGTIAITTPVIEHGGSTWGTWGALEVEQRPSGLGAVAGTQVTLYCQKCGTAVSVGEKKCPSCGTPIILVNYSTVAVNRVKDAFMDSLRALRLFGLNPVGGLSGAFESLGQARALGAGIIFGLASALCVLFLMYSILPASGNSGSYADFLDTLTFLPTSSYSNSIAGFLNILTFSLAPFVSVFAAHFIARKVFRGKGAAGHDAFVSGAFLLPWGVVAVFAAIVAILNQVNIEVTIAAIVFAVSLSTLMLYAGLTKICQTSERAATLAIPLIFLTSILFSRLICAIILKIVEEASQAGFL